MGSRVETPKNRTRECPSPVAQTRRAPAASVSGQRCYRTSWYSKGTDILPARKVGDGGGERVCELHAADHVNELAELGGHGNGGAVDQLGVHGKMVYDAEFHLLPLLFVSGRVLVLSLTMPFHRLTQSFLPLVPRGIGTPLLVQLLYAGRSFWSTNLTSARHWLLRLLMAMPAAAPVNQGR